MKEKTIKMIGYRIEGEVSVNFWGGGQGVGRMQSFEIYHPEFSLDDLKRVIPQGLNDNGHGVESFNSASVEVYELYERGVTYYADQLEFDNSVKFGCGFFEEGLNAKMI